MKRSGLNAKFLDSKPKSKIFVHCCSNSAPQPTRREEDEVATFLHARRRLPWDVEVYLLGREASAGVTTLALLHPEEHVEGTALLLHMDQKVAESVNVDVDTIARIRATLFIQVKVLRLSMRLPVLTIRTILTRTMVLPAMILPTLGLTMLPRDVENND